ncbi:MAG: hypothetical protein AB1505_23200 [Candidatus Latescibacterota bacterium]
MNGAAYTVRRTAVICRVGRHLGFQWRLGGEAGFWMTTRRDTEDRLRGMGATHIEEVEALESGSALFGRRVAGPPAAAPAGG